MLPPKQWDAALSLAGLALAACALAFVLIDRPSDSAYLTYRYVQNLSSGAGFAYNPGQPALIPAVSPPWAALLAALTVTNVDLPLLGALVNTAGITLSAAALFMLLWQPSEGGSTWGAALGAGLLLAFPLLWLWPGQEAALWLALCLWAAWFHVKGWAVPAAVMLALAVLTRPDALLLGALMLAFSFAQNRPFHPAPLIVFGCLVGLGALWGALTFAQGGPLPALLVSGPANAEGRLPALIEMASAVMGLSWLWSVPALLALAGLPAAPQRPAALMIGGWGLLHLLTWLVMPGGSGPLALLPVIAALAVLAGLGLEWLAARLASLEQARPVLPVLYAGAALLSLGAAADSLVKVYGTDVQPGWAALAPPLSNPEAQTAGAWIAANAPPQAQIGLTRTGALAYYTGDQPVLDYGGSLQPELAEAYARSDGAWWLSSLTPDYVVLTPAEHQQLGTYRPAEDPWFIALYAEAARFGEGDSALIIFQKQGEPRPMADNLVGLVSFPNGLSLSGRIATDFSLSPLQGTDSTGRMRLQWLATRRLEGVQHVGLRIQGRGENGALAAFGGGALDFSRWQIDRLYDTYHTVTLLPGMPPGVYDVQVGIGPDENNLHWETITQAKVPFPQDEVLGAFSGIRAQFGDLLLTGYRINRTASGLDISLMWQAVSLPRLDYSISIQLRDAGGVVAAQTERQPYDGAYPTSVWSAGERVPDVYPIDISSVPPGEYGIFVGLRTPEGQQVLTDTGQDSVFIGPTIIQP